jgi:hypothetical protein
MPSWANDGIHGYPSSAPRVKFDSQEIAAQNPRNPGTAVPPAKARERNEASVERKIETRKQASHSLHPLQGYHA